MVERGGMAPKMESVDFDDETVAYSVLRLHCSLRSGSLCL